MSFIQDVNVIVSNAQKEMRAKSTEEKREFLIRSGILNEQGLLAMKFKVSSSEQTAKPSKKIAKGSR